MIIAGIDPGLGGAIAFMKVGEDNLPSLFQVEDCPVLAGEIDVKELLNLFKDRDRWPSLIGIEKAQAMRKGGIVQGSVSIFNYGRSYGQYLGMFATLGLPYMEVMAHVWKREFNLIKKTKEDSVLTAKKLYPETSSRLTRKKDHGRAEAILIAEYTRRKFDGFRGYGNK